MIRKLADCQVLGIPVRNGQPSSLSSKVYISSVVPDLSPGPAPRQNSEAGLSLSAVQPDWTPEHLRIAAIVQGPTGLLHSGRWGGSRGLM